MANSLPRFYKFPTESDLYEGVRASYDSLKVEVRSRVEKSDQVTLLVHGWKKCIECPYFIAFVGSVYLSAHLLTNFIVLLKKWSTTQRI